MISFLTLIMGWIRKRRLPALRYKCSLKVLLNIGEVTTIKLFIGNMNEAYCKIERSMDFNISFLGGQHPIINYIQTNVILNLGRPSKGHTVELTVEKLKDFQYFPCEDNIE